MVFDLTKDMQLEQEAGSSSKDAALDSKEKK
jgi:hypothetical protein